MHWWCIGEGRATHDSRETHRSSAGVTSVLLCGAVSTRGVGRRLFRRSKGCAGGEGCVLLWDDLSRARERMREDDEDDEVEMALNTTSFARRFRRPLTSLIPHIPLNISRHRQLQRRRVLWRSVEFYV